MFAIQTMHGIAYNFDGKVRQTHGYSNPHIDFSQFRNSKQKTTKIKKKAIYLFFFVVCVGHNQ